jgi:hypothetical protein
VRAGEGKHRRRVLFVVGHGRAGTFNAFLTVYDGAFHTEVTYGTEELRGPSESLLR